MSMLFAGKKTKYPCFSVEMKQKASLFSKENMDILP